MDNGHELDPKDDALGIVRFIDEQDSMERIDIPAHVAASTKDPFSQTDNSVQHTAVDNTTPGEEQKAASTDNQVSIVWR